MKKSGRSGNRTFNGNHFDLPATFAQHFAKFVRKGALHVPRIKEPCDLWVGAVEGAGNPFGRGAYFWATSPRAGGKTKQSAASAMYRHARLDGASLVPGEVVCHRCDVESCVNPEHLFVGTPYMNGSDRRVRGAAVEQGVAQAAVAAHLALFARRERELSPWLVRAVARLNMEQALEAALTSFVTYGSK